MYYNLKRNRAGLRSQFIFFIFVVTCIALLGTDVDVVKTIRFCVYSSIIYCSAVDSVVQFFLLFTYFVYELVGLFVLH